MGYLHRSRFDSFDISAIKTERGAGWSARNSISRQVTTRDENYDTLTDLSGRVDSIYSARVPRKSKKKEKERKKRRERNERKREKKKKKKREREEGSFLYCISVAVSTRRRRIKGKASTRCGRVEVEGWGRVKSWSRFTSYHLWMSRQLPLALPTVARQRKFVQRHYRGLPKHDSFSPPWSLRAGENSKGLWGSLFFRLDYIGENSWNGKRERGAKRGAIKVSLIRLADDSKKERSTAWKGFLGARMSR